MKTHKFVYLFLGIILVAAFFVRIYRVETILGFYFDQGRDALVVWDFIFDPHKPFLIGPTTGLAGIFRGPYYYYFLAPFYLLGQGDPVFPAVGLAVTAVIAIVIVFYLASKIMDRTTGLIAAVIAGFSFNIIFASRWLSNPTPMLVLSMILVLGMFEIARSKPKTKGKNQWWWIVISFVYGLSLFNFGSSGEFFYTSALVLFVIWQAKRKNLPSFKYIVASAIALSITFAPLILFDFKHDHILVNNFTSTFGSGSGSFQIPSLEFIKSRNNSYFDIFVNKIFQDRGRAERLVLAIVSGLFVIFLPKLIKKTGVKIILLLLVSAIVGLYFFQGNYGVLYDYYMTGYYLIFVLLFAITLGMIWKYKVGKIIVIYFFYLFFMNNLPVSWSKMTDGCIGENSICFVNQKQAIEWIYKDAREGNFNVDVYVPPVIPYAYDYLLKWKANVYLKSDQVPLLYTLYEADPPHPERLDAWLARQKGIGKVEETYKTGGITVERRIRIQ